MGSIIDSPLVCIFLALFIRALGLTLPVPFELSVLGFSQRMSFSAAMALFVMGSVDTITIVESHALISEAVFINLLLNFLLGFVLGLPLALLLQSAKLLGEMVDIGRGQNIANSYDPVSQSVDTFTDQLLHAALWIVVLWSGALEVLVKVYINSLTVWNFGADFGSLLDSISRTIIFLIGNWLNVAFKLLCPLVVGYFLVDWAGAFLNKLLPQISLFSESFQIKTCLAIIFIWTLCQQVQVEDLLATVENAARVATR